MRRHLPVPVLDAVLAVLCVGLAWAELLVWHEWSTESRVLQGAAITVLCAALSIRRASPLAAVVVMALATTAMTAAGDPPQILAVGLCAMLVAYTVGAALEGRHLLLAAAVFVAAWLARDVADPRINGFDIAIDGVFFVMAFAVGRVVRRRERRVELVAQAAVGRADDAVRLERARIARELHDVIAHGLSVIVVQADAAQHEVDPADVQTAAAFDRIERTGRESLREMRRLLGLLRDEAGSGGAELEPQPGLAGVPALVESVRLAGLRVQLRVGGEPRALSPGVDLAAYRIVQEALTNALRHAGPAEAIVDLDYGAHEVTVRIADTGRARDGDGNGDGRGLVGMRERAQLYGGRFDAHRGKDGFEVMASLPYETTR